MSEIRKRLAGREGRGLTESLNLESEKVRDGLTPCRMSLCVRLPEQLR